MILEYVQFKISVIGEDRYNVDRIHLQSYITPSCTDAYLLDNTDRNCISGFNGIGKLESHKSHLGQGYVLYGTDSVYALILVEEAKIMYLTHDISDTFDDEIAEIERNCVIESIHES